MAQQPLKESMERSKAMYQDVLDHLKDANEENKRILQEIKSNPDISDDMIKQWVEEEESIGRQLRNSLNDRISGIVHQLPQIDKGDMKKEWNKTIDRAEELVHKMLNMVRSQ